MKRIFVIYTLFFAVFYLTVQAQTKDDARFVVDDSKTTPQTILNPKLPTFFIIGDSTLRSDAPMRGWGQELGQFFNQAKINVVNRAIGGRSSRTFQYEGRWDKNLAELKKGDFVIIPKVTIKSDEPIFLDGMTYDDLKSQFAIPVYDVDTNGLIEMLKSEPLRKQAWRR